MACKHCWGNDCKISDRITEKSSVPDNEADDINYTDFVEYLDVNFPSDFNFKEVTLNDLDTYVVIFDDEHLIESDDDEDEDESIF